MFFTLITWFRNLIKALQDNSSSTNANSVRIMALSTDIRALTIQTAASNVALSTLTPLIQRLVDSLSSDAIGFSLALAQPDGSDAIQGDSPMAVQLPDSTGPKLLTLTPRDAKGFPTTLDGGATFTASDTTLVTLTQQADLVVRLDFLDTTPGKQLQIQFSGDARMGADVVPVTGTLDITFIAGEAVSIEGGLSDAVPAV